MLTNLCFCNIISTMNVQVSLRYRDIEDIQKFRVSVVKYYLSHGESCTKTARHYKIHRNTVNQWVKWYKKGGEENLLRTRIKQRPWNRSSFAIEAKVIFLKEREPSLTIRQLQIKLGKQGIKLSQKCIFNILKRYGLAGLQTGGHIASPPLDKLLNRRDIKTKLLPPRIIDYFKLRNRIDNFNPQMDKIHYSEIYQSSKSLRIQAEKKKLFYSALRAGIIEIIALEWLGQFKISLSLINRFLKRISKRAQPVIRIRLLIHKGTSLACLSDFNEALLCAKMAEKILRRKKFPNPLLMLELAQLYTSLRYYKKAAELIQVSIEITKNSNDEIKKFQISGIAMCLAFAGDYKHTLNILKNENIDNPQYQCLGSWVKAHCFLGEGKLYKAKEQLLIAINKAKKEEIINYLHTATLLLSSIYAGLANKQKSDMLLKNMIPILRKSKIERDLIITKFLLRDDIKLDESVLGFPTIHIAYLLKLAAQTHRISYYDKAVYIAKKYGILGIFHRFLLFFPEVVKICYAKRGSVEIPRSLLKLPVFNENAFVFHIKFLGRFIIFRNNRRWSVKFSSIEKAFLIYLATSLRKEYNLDFLYQNYWSRSSHPEHNLSQLLWRLRKKLIIPNYLLKVKKSNALLVNEGVIFTTDYQYYKEIITRAKALLRAGEWGFAKREFLRAFKLFRGEPFKKMYDDWSDDKRLEVLFSYEKEVKTFADELRKRGKTEEAERVLERAERIVGSE